MAGHRAGRRRVCPPDPAARALSVTSIRHRRGIRDLDTEDLPDKAIYIPCGDRRASVCPACAETYRATPTSSSAPGWQAAKAVPESVATHPCVFATFTAPSFGPVHTRAHQPAGGRVARCRPRRKPNYCPHGRRLSCRRSGTKTPKRASASRCARTATTTTPPWCGTPTPPNCGGAPSSGSGAGWTSSPRPTAPGSSCPTPRWPSSSAAAWSTSTPSSASTATTRIHPERTVPPHPAFTAEVLADAIRAGRELDLVRHRRPPGQAGRLGHRLGRPARLRAWSGSPMMARSPTSRSRPTWPNTRPNPPRPSAALPGRITPANLHHLRQSRQPPGQADPRRLAPRRTTRTTTSRRCAAGRTCSATAATSPPKAAATPPPCERSAPPAGDWQRRQHPIAERTRRQRPSSRSRICNGPAAAGAPPETPLLALSAAAEPASTSGSLAKRSP